MKDSVFDIDFIDFYDWKKLDKLHERRAKKWLKLFVKAKQGDLKAIEKIKEHEAQDRELKRRADTTGYYWV